MKIVTIVPVNGREDILCQTIPRMIRQVDRVIVGGHNEREREICAGADFLKFVPETKVGAKWQTCLYKAREYNPDAILIMGSGGMVSDNWIDILYPELSSYDMTGTAGIYFWEQSQRGQRMFYWPGYTGSRSREPIGIGRLISACFLDKCEWKLFNTGKNRGLDASVTLTIDKFGGKMNVHHEQDISVIRLSSYKYQQYDSYDKLRRHYLAKDVDNIDEFIKRFYESNLY